jgi:hypothetical protein
MKLIDHDEALRMAQDTLIWKRLPDKLQSIFLTSMMDLSDQLQAELVARNTSTPDDDFYARGEAMWAKLGLDK